MPPANKRHVYLIEKLSDILKGQLNRRTHLVTSSGAGVGIERVPLTYRIPDLMVFRSEALIQDKAATAGNDPYIWTTPDLLVECLSPANRKGAVRELLNDYEQISVPEVWLLNPDQPWFTSYRYESGALHEFETAETGVVTALLLPAVSVDTTDLWAAFAGL